MFIEGRSVKSPQTMIIFWKMSGDPIENDPDPMLMTVVHKVLEVLWRTITARRGEIAGRLIAPTSCKRMLVDRHQFQMREAHLLAVLHQFMGQVTIVLPAMKPLLILTPTSKMNLVNRDGFLQIIGCGPAI